jgi:hypothetical protein
MAIEMKKPNAFPEECTIPDRAHRHLPVHSRQENEHAGSSRGATMAIEAVKFSAAEKGAPDQFRHRLRGNYRSVDCLQLAHTHIFCR